MLFESTDIAVWEAVLGQYPEALEHHVANKKDDSLLELDQWYQTTLPTLLNKRSPKPFITSKELCQLMSWKLKRGKFRPSLAKLAASNVDTDVKRISLEAFALVNSDLKAAITKMAELKGVGPATASAILCAGAPEKVPFMTDETMDSVPGLGTIVYTIPYYIKFANKVIEKATQLRHMGSTTVHSPHLVEKALWTDYMLDKYSIERKVKPFISRSQLESDSRITKEDKKNKTPTVKSESKSAGNKRKAGTGEETPSTVKQTKEDAAADSSAKKIKTIDSTSSKTSTRFTRSRA
ncbi:hypothetical protein BX616_008005 [Lobosporangium transversale]|uniref:Uncharacterized protein n=1 Tax=Lobosporangium transversale TaxID=64571 RepID=A0A1Y2H227_9FUNG|nr:hypothetical protein BCR41DRAFT_382614 [Lobosporangium transversale]KAF9914576.1 hypothetical protein BX616_008005 [Lobosporangium transversale]ORZ28629.1 hypothetical protein BCR41DRAFT_382614 [Lobosporangium transversale]|eukprot:XP_021886302.1 hypothetical protein BCR41DRAFT_382614 [Lobosporangium transversale]